MEKTIKHRFLNNAFFTAFLVPLASFLLRDTIAVFTGIMFKSMGGEAFLLYQINDDVARLIIASLLILIMPIFFRENCTFRFCGGKIKLGIILALPELIVPLWNLLQIKVYHAPLVTGTTVAGTILGVQKNWQTRLWSFSATVLLTVGVLIWATFNGRVI